MADAVTTTPIGAEDDSRHFAALLLRYRADQFARRRIPEPAYIVVIPRRKALAIGRERYCRNRRLRPLKTAEFFAGDRVPKANGLDERS